MCERWRPSGSGGEGYQSCGNGEHVATDQKSDAKAERRQGDLRERLQV